jgi:hypothetical protein
MTETVMEEYPWVGMRLDEGSPGERGRYQASASVSFVYISVKVSVGFRSALGGCSSLVTATLTRLIRSKEYRRKVNRWQRISHQHRS